MSGIETKREWERLLDEYTAACAAFDAANGVIASTPLDRRAADADLAAAELAEDKACGRLLAVVQQMREFDPEHPESLPIG
jgi:hypothetical protein